MVSEIPSFPPPPEKAESPVPMISRFFRRSAGHTGVVFLHPILASHTDWERQKGEHHTTTTRPMGISWASGCRTPRLHHRWPDGSAQPRCANTLLQWFPPCALQWRHLCGDQFWVAPWRGAPVPRIETRFAIFIISPSFLRQIMATKMVEVCAGLVSLCFALLLLVGTRKVSWFDCGRARRHRRDLPFQQFDFLRC